MWYTENTEIKEVTNGKQKSSCYFGLY